MASGPCYRKIFSFSLPNCINVILTPWLSVSFAHMWRWNQKLRHHHQKQRQGRQLPEWKRRKCILWQARNLTLLKRFYPHVYKSPFFSGSMFIMMYSHLLPFVLLPSIDRENPWGFSTSHCQSRSQRVKWQNFGELFLYSWPLTLFTSLARSCSSVKCGTCSILLISQCLGHGK